MADNSDSKGILTSMLRDFRYWYIVLVTIVFALTLAFFETLPSPLNQRLVVGVLIYLLCFGLVVECQVLWQCRSGKAVLRVCAFCCFTVLKVVLLLGLIFFLFCTDGVMDAINKVVHIEQVNIERVDHLENRQ